MQTAASLALMAAIVSSCATTTPQPNGPALTKPLASQMAPVEDLPDILTCEAKPTCRAPYYARSREMYASLKQRHLGLQRYVIVATVADGAKK